MYVKRQYIQLSKFYKVIFGKRLVGINITSEGRMDIILYCIKDNIWLNYKKRSLPCYSSPQSWYVKQRPKGKLKSTHEEVV